MVINRTPATHPRPMASNEWQLSRAKLQSSLEASGPCACGRSTCARKTNDATLLQARQQMNRCQHPRRAKLQSSLEASSPSWTCSASPERSRSRALPVISAGTCPFIQNVTATCMLRTESEGDLSIRQKSSPTVRDHSNRRRGTAQAHHQTAKQVCRSSSSDGEATWSSVWPRLWRTAPTV